MRRTALIVTMVGALALAGCETAEDEGPGQVEPTPTVTAPSPAGPTAGPEPTEGTESPQSTASPTDGEDGVAAMSFTECEADRYTVGYPEDWNTNDPQGALDACQVFHPGDIEVEPNQEIGLHYAAVLYIDAVDFETVRESDNPNEVLEERETTVDGRDALVIEFRSTGDALTPEGEQRYAYYVDLDGEILVAATHSIGDSDYERDKEILDRMITEELTIHE